jgi:hypothetical protein
VNIFYTDKNPKTCASHHCDKHTVKMILEYSQLLSTAHRVIDGKLSTGISDKGRKTSSWILSDNRNDLLYKATHLNHPSAVWVRQSLSNYMWLSHLLAELCKEYTYRYGKIHKCEYSGLVNTLLNNAPKNIPNTTFTEPTPAMPDDYKVKGDSVKSYINYINGAKKHLHSWKNREVPYFITG